MIRSTKTNDRHSDSSTSLTIARKGRCSSGVMRNTNKRSVKWLKDLRFHDIRGLRWSVVKYAKSRDHQIELSWMQKGAFKVHPTRTGPPDRLYIKIAPSCRRGLVQTAMVKAADFICSTAFTIAAIEGSSQISAKSLCIGFGIPVANCYGPMKRSYAWNLFYNAPVVDWKSQKTASKL